MIAKKTPRLIHLGLRHKTPLYFQRPVHDFAYCTCKGLESSGFTRVEAFYCNFFVLHPINADPGNICYDRFLGVFSDHSRFPGKVAGLGDFRCALRFRLPGQYSDKEPTRPPITWLNWRGSPCGNPPLCSVHGYFANPTIGRRI